MPSVDINILTPRALVEKAELAQLLSLICARFPKFAPENYGFYEPIRSSFSCGEVVRCLDGWQQDQFFWTRKRPRSDGQILSAFSHKPVHTFIGIRAELRSADFDSAVDLVKCLADVLNADLAFIHSMDDRERLRMSNSGAVVCLDPRSDKYGVMVTTHQLERYIPDLFWGTVFGPPYVGLFGCEAIKGTPARVVCGLDYGGFYVQITDSIEGIHHDYEGFALARMVCKSHLNSNAFFDDSLPASYPYRVPSFQLEHQGRNAVIPLYEPLAGR